MVRFDVFVKHLFGLVFLYHDRDGSKSDLMLKFD